MTTTEKVLCADYFKNSVLRIQYTFAKFIKIGETVI